MSKLKALHTEYHTLHSARRKTIFQSSKSAANACMA